VVLDSYRGYADVVLTPLARRLRTVEPDALTWIAFICAIAAGLFFFIGGLIGVLLAFIFVVLNALFDALDGKIARVTGKESARGDFLDHVLDRYADVFIVGGIMLGPYCNIYLGLLAMLGVIFTSYMGTQAQAVGVGRDYGGIAGRADRLMVLMIAALLQIVLLLMGSERIGILPEIELTFLECAMIIYAVGGHITAIQRGLSTWKKL